VEPAAVRDLAELWGELPMGRLGEVVAPEGAETGRLVITGLERTVLIDVSVDDLEKTWKKPLDWFSAG
jgi:hypothetical protein